MMKLHQGRTLHLRFQNGTVGCAIAANESGRIVKFAAMPAHSEAEFQFFVTMMRHDIPNLVTPVEFLLAKSQWERDRRNMHYCKRKIFDWTLHCEPRGESLLEMLKYQTAVYHGIKNEPYIE